MARPRLYLLVVISPALQQEHATITRAVEFHSDGDFVQVFQQAASMPGAKAAGTDIPFSVGFLFSTTKPPSEMGFQFQSRDRYLLIEVTTNHWAQDLSVARNWLDRHREPG